MLLTIATPLAIAGGSISQGAELDLLALVLAAGPVVKGVMLLLFAFSVISWAIMIAKFRQLHRAQGQDAEFIARFWEASAPGAILDEARRLTFSPAAAIFRQAYQARLPRKYSGNPGNSGNSAPDEPRDALRRVVGRALLEQNRKLSRSLSFLATCGNTAPFIGLFGTVWGIMAAFHAIGLKGSASLGTVAPGIAEALIATAAGLAVAIPAVMAYNYFLSRVRRLEGDLTAFANDLVPRLQAEPPGAAVIAVPE